MEPTTMTIATILGYITEIIGKVPTWVSSAISAVTSNNLLLLLVLFGLVGTGIGLLRRLIRL